MTDFNDSLLWHLTKFSEKQHKTEESIANLIKEIEDSSSFTVNRIVIDRKRDEIIITYHCCDKKG